MALREHVQLDAFGRQLNLLDLLSQRAGGARRDRGGRLSQFYPRRAQRFHNVFLPYRNGFTQMCEIVAVEVPAPGHAEPQAIQNQIDVGAEPIL
jgi:hypothetical protein